MTAETSAPALLSVGGLAALLDISQRTVYRLDSSGRIPKPLKLGASLRWRRKEVVAWIAAGMPDRHTWEEIHRLEAQGGA